MCFNRHIQPGEYRWVLAWTLAFTEMTSWGILYYTFSILLTPMQREFGWTTETLTGAFSLALLVSGFAAVLVGRWLARYGARVVMSFGSGIAVFGVAGWSQVQTPAQLYVAWVVIGLAMAAVLYDPAFTVIATWFSRHRSRALTILTFGGGLASVVFVPLTTLLLNRHGWRQALLILAFVLFIATVLPHIILLRRRPHDSTEVYPSTISVGSSSIRQAITQPNFWWLSAAFALISFVSAALSVHLIPYLSTRGLPSETIALYVSVLGGSQIIGRLLLTPLGGWISQRILTTVMFGMGTIALVILVSQQTEFSILVFAVMLGTGYGASAPARAALVADLFGTARYAEINGLMAFMMTIARAAGPTGAGLVLSQTRNYPAVYWLLVVLAFGGAIATLMIRPAPKY